MRKKGIKGIHIGKEALKMSLFTDETIVLVENPKVITSNLLQAICIIWRLKDTRLIYKSQLLSYLPLWTNGVEIKNTILFTLVSFNLYT